MSQTCLYYSIGERGRPIGVPARDVATYYQKLGSFGTQNALDLAEVAAAQGSRLTVVSGRW